MKFTWLKLIIMFFTNIFTKEVHQEQNKKNDQPLPIPFVGDDFTPEATTNNKKKKINCHEANFIYQTRKWGYLGGRGKEWMGY